MSLCIEKVASMQCEQIHAADTLMFLHLTNLFVCRSSFVQAFGIAIVCCHHVKPAFNILRGSAGRCKQREPFRGLGMCSRERSRSAERLADRFAAQKGRFLPWDHDNKDAAVRRRRCFNPQCPRKWTSSPYCLWVHFSCTATQCISYLHDETARIQTELRSLDRRERESIRSMKGSGR